MPLAPIKKMFQRLKFEIWKSIHRLPLGLIQLWQLYSLQRLIRHAYANTALYRDLWDKRSLNPSQLKHFSDFQNFPIVNKKIFLAAPRESYIGLVKSQFYTWRSTSGTSGEPFTFLSVNDRRALSADFLTYRFLYWEGRTLASIQNETRIVVIQGMDGTKISYRSRVLMPLHSFLSERKKTMKEIYEISPSVIATFPSVLIELALAANEYSEFKNFKVPYVLSYGENLKLYQRKFIEETLSCEVIDNYGLAEFGPVATECRYHRGFHLNVETFVLEIVDDSGFPVPFGERGRIVITDLRNYAMPFIRYDTGDQGCFLKGACPCGLEGEWFMVEGRGEEFFASKSGYIHHSDIDEIMKKYFGAILQYQVAKIDEYAITLFIIRGPAMTEFILEHIREKVQTLIGKDCHLNIESVTEIKRTPRGKCQIVINL